MKGTYRGEKKRKEEFSIEEFTLQIKRKAMGFTSAGLAIFIMTFSYYVIGMEDNKLGKTNPDHQALPQEKSDTSEDTNTSDQFAINDKSSQSDATDLGEIFENGNSQTEASPSSKTPSSQQANHSSDMDTIVEPSEELPIYEKGELPPDNEKQDPGESCFKWRHPGFLEKLDPCKRKDIIQSPEHNTKEFFEKIIPQNKIKNKPRLPENQHEINQHKENRYEEKRYEVNRYEEKRYEVNQYEEKQNEENQNEENQNEELKK